MCKKSVFWGVGLLWMVLLVSCGSQGQKDKEVEKEKIPQLVGADRDDHGCIASAGYQWSELLRDCIRPWEKGIKLTSVHDSLSNFAAYLVFNADSSEIEVFLPRRKVRPLLHRDTVGHAESWSCEEDPDIMVERNEGQWNIYQKGKLFFKE